jgi:hypothetical protein
MEMSTAERQSLGGGMTFALFTPAYQRIGQTDFFETPCPLFIETGEACLDVVAMRLNQLTAKLKGTSRPVTQSPLLLVLLAQNTCRCLGG